MMDDSVQDIFTRYNPKETAKLFSPKILLSNWNTRSFLIVNKGYSYSTAKSFWNKLPQKDVEIRKDGSLKEKLNHSFSFFL